MPSFKSEKLRVNLRLCINRLKLLEKKKSKLFHECFVRIMSPLHLNLCTVCEARRSKFGYGTSYML